MPKKVNVVSLSDIKPIDDDDNEEIKDIPHAEEDLTQIKEAIREEEQIQPVEDPKPKPKRNTTRAKPEVLSPDKVRVKPAKKQKEEVVEEPIVVEPVVEESVVVEEKPTKTKPEKPKKELEYITCEKCNKTMLKKSYRYNHEQSCKGKPREELPVKKRSQLKEPTPKPMNKNNYENIPIVSSPINIPEEMIQKEITRRLTQQKESRIKAKQEHYQKLGSQIV